ncbi:zf-CHY-domain-containing protein [Durotheca rogersii]|uniref:zf-CHY-domain-containing protein n=1 Tax=Durotheca rogersii TaxID=419775 RepID=UPI00221F41C0|nr:zf-CHY-domain-containing protein [Durotheca rogersii]KAI5862386.1 zf-CHY-domain-containing protein [Durotheca rogersii]
MTSLVTDFLVNPVVRQARRFSRSSANLPTPKPVSPPHPVREPKEGLDKAISETEEDLYLDGEVAESLSSSASSRSSVRSYPGGDAVDSIRLIGQPNHATAYTDIGTPDTQILGTEPRSLQRPVEMAPPSRPRTMEDTPVPAVDDSLSGSERRKPLPEDDGMGALRKRIFAIQAQDIDASEKASMMHLLLLEGYTKSKKIDLVERPLSPSSSTVSEQRQYQGPLDSFRFWQNISGEPEVREEFDLTPQDLQPTFASLKDSSEDSSEDPEVEDSYYRPLGCEHYRRNVKLQCFTCGRWYTCRFCHDKAEDHTLIRNATKNMLCMFCGTAQRASDVCISCSASASRYYCSICKLWNDDPDKPVYHCNDCGICRIGRGLGKDFFHCKTCCACIAISQKDHKCIERSTDCDCPICGDYMFTSPKAVCFMKCGHSIHRQCLDQHMKVAYKCPICNRSLANMELQFRNLDIAIETQPMPAEFQDTRALILCNDCSAKSSVRYHWLGLKCGICSSYNTAQLQIHGMANEAIETDLRGRETSPVELAASRAILLRGGDGDGARDVRRRHSSNIQRPATAEPFLDSLDRLARSVSPPPSNAHSWSPPAGYLVETEDEARDDIIGFWSRVPRSIASGGDDDGTDASEGETLSSSEDEEDEEAEEEDEDDFELLGHR